MPALRLVTEAHPAASPPPRFGRSTKVTGEILRAADIAVAVTALLVVFAVTNADPFASGVESFLVIRVTSGHLLLLAGFVLLWPILLAPFQLYELAKRGPVRREAARVLGACSVGALAAIPLLAATGDGLGVYAVASFWAVVVATTLIVRILVRLGDAPAWKTAPARRILIVGSGRRALDLHARLAGDGWGRDEVLGFVDSSPGELERIGQAPLARLDELETFLMHNVVDTVLIALPIRSCYGQIQEVLHVCERVGVEARYLADVFQHSLAQPRYDASSTVPLVSLHVAPDDHRLVLKRGLDLLGAAVGLVLLAPVFLGIAVAIKLTSPGPVFFTQRRYGYNKRLFRMFKFRTMVPDAEALQGTIEHLNEASGPAFKIRHDPRLTPIGAFLRRTSLDELPQLLNVLRGEMSLVGPRPMSVRDVSRFPEARLMRRFSVTPGLTCLWQISGRSDLSFDDWIGLDLKYIDTWSLGLDLRILTLTVPVVLRGKGAV